MTKQDDDVAEWAMSQSKCFIPFDDVQEQHLITVMTDHELLVKNTKKKNAADPFVIALAKTHGIAVITEEQEGSPGKPKIPDVCRAMGIAHLSVLELMRREGWIY